MIKDVPWQIIESAYNNGYEQGHKEASEQDYWGVDMHNNFYEYAIIERIEPGIFMVDTDRVIYQWNNDKYEKIETPKELTTVSNFGIG